MEGTWILILVTFKQCSTQEPLYMHVIEDMSFETAVKRLDEYAANLSFVLGKKIVYILEYEEELETIKCLN